MLTDEQKRIAMEALRELLAARPTPADERPAAQPASGEESVATELKRKIEQIIHDKYCNEEDSTPEALAAAILPVALAAAAYYAQLSSPEREPVEEDLVAAIIHEWQDMEGEDDLTQHAEVAISIVLASRTPSVEKAAEAASGELLPCPFCGSQPVTQWEPGPELYIHCNNDACLGASFQGPDAEVVVALWDGRSSMDESHRLEQLRTDRDFHACNAVEMMRQRDEAINRRVPAPSGASGQGDAQEYYGPHLLTASNGEQARCRGDIRTCEFCARIAARPAPADERPAAQPASVQQIAKEIIGNEAVCIEWGATAERSVQLAEETLLKYRRAVLAEAGLVKLDDVENALTSQIGYIITENEIADILDRLSTTETARMRESEGK